MSTEAPAPETLGSLSDERVVDPNSSAAKEIAGKSPMQIALRRLVKDKIAMVCALVVLFFILCAVFAGPICKLFGVSIETGLASEYVDGLNGGLPLPEYGWPNGTWTVEHPLGLAPQSGDDNLAFWLYGLRTSLVIATTASVIAVTVGVVIGLIAGFLARALVPGKDSMSLVGTLLLGVSGSVVGGLILGFLFGGFRDRGFSPAGIIGSVIGAVIVLLLYNRLSSRRAPGTTARRGAA